jgi:hypothetical protein
MLGMRMSMLAVAVVVLVGSGSASWAQFGASGVIAGCVGPFGLIRGVDETTGSCRPREQAIFWYTKEGADAAFGFGCPPDSVRSGRSCIDKYEASVWETTDAAVIAKIRSGTATLGDLTLARAVQRGAAGDDYGSGCPATGNRCVNLYAVSIPGVLPSHSLTWFQATAVARNSGKRLPTNAEWQAAALGTPDGTDCHVPVPGGPGPFGTVPTGSKGNCVSDVGAFDMVGNLVEWVADWVPQSPTNCDPPLFAETRDFNCLAGPYTNGGPAALWRGGVWADGAGAGVFMVAGSAPSNSGNAVGFRAVR